MREVSMEPTVTLRPAYLVMFEFLQRERMRSGKSEELGALLSSLALWGEANGKGAPKPAAMTTRARTLACQTHRTLLSSMGGHDDEG